jgi:hypothetical protein
VSGQLHAPAALPPVKEPQYPLDRSLGGLQSRSEGGAEEKISQHPPGLEPQNSVQPVARPIITVRLQVAVAQLTVAHLHTHSLTNIPPYTQYLKCNEVHKIVTRIQSLESEPFLQEIFALATTPRYVSSLGKMLVTFTVTFRRWV